MFAAEQLGLAKLSRRELCEADDSLPHLSPLHPSFLTRAFSGATRQQRSNIPATRDRGAREQLLPAACRRREERGERNLTAAGGEEEVHYFFICVGVLYKVSQSARPKIPESEKKNKK